MELLSRKRVWPSKRRCLVDWEYSNLQKNAEKAQLSAQFKDLIDL
jgi:hypothetical protein